MLVDFDLKLHYPVLHTFSTVLHTTYCFYILSGNQLSLCWMYHNLIIALNVLVAGVLMFVCGLIANVHSDHILRTLRKPGETGYKIPQGLVNWNLHFLFLFLLSVRTSFRNLTVVCLVVISL